MKNLFLTTVLVLFLSANFFSQTTPIPPKTSKVSKGTSYSITFDTDVKEDNSSVSIKRDDNVYKFTARFHESKTGSIKKMLVNKFGNSNLSITGGTYRWIKNENGEKLYDCKLTETTLKIYVDKEYATSKIVNMMDEFGIILKDAISRTDSKAAAKKDAQRALKNAEREFSRAKKELERAKSKNKKS